MNASTGLEANPAYRCKVCGTLKGETNHWRLLWAGPFAGVKRMFISEWTTWLAQDLKLVREDQVAAAACGYGCTQKLVSRWLETGTFDGPTVRSELAQKASETNG